MDKYQEACNYAKEKGGFYGKDLRKALCIDMETEFELIDKMEKNGLIDFAMSRLEPYCLLRNKCSRSTNKDLDEFSLRIREMIERIDSRSVY